MNNVQGNCKSFIASWKMEHWNSNKSFKEICLDICKTTIHYFWNMSVWTSVRARVCVFVRLFLYLFDCLFVCIESVSGVKIIVRVLLSVSLGLIITFRLFDLSFFSLFRMSIVLSGQSSFTNLIFYLSTVSYYNLGFERVTELAFEAYFLSLFKIAVYFAIFIIRRLQIAMPYMNQNHEACCSYT